MSENLIYADLNLTEPTGPRLKKSTDVQDATYAEVKVQSPGTNAVTSHASPGKSRCSRRCVAVLVAVTILLLVLAACLIFMYHASADSPSDSKTLSTTYERALDHATESSPSDSETFSTTSGKTLGCPQGWSRNGGKCYFFSQIQNKSWEDSRKECTASGSDLVIIESKEELNYLGKTSKQSGKYYFIGLRYSKKKWMWINDVEHSTDRFEIGGKQDDYFCTVIGPRQVETASCGGAQTTHILCEKPANISERKVHHHSLPRVLD